MNYVRIVKDQHHIDLEVSSITFGIGRDIDEDDNPLELFRTIQLTTPAGFINIEQPRDGDIIWMYDENLQCTGKLAWPPTEKLVNRGQKTSIFGLEDGDTPPNGAEIGNFGMIIKNGIQNTEGVLSND